MGSSITIPCSVANQGDGLFSIERVECLGQCEKAPAMMINEEVYGYLDQERLVVIFDMLRSKI
ncbi:MAG: hypothetical protein GY799_05915 [Desulfobulbaceae bacterium]|nr:hypothetical protein [Desulfobulbaceae bacterium]